MELAKEFTMLEVFIKFFFILITTIYTFYKLLNHSPRTKYIQSFLIFLSATISAFICLLSKKQPTLCLVILFSIFFLTMMIIEQLPLTLTYITSLFAYALSYIVFTFSIIFTSVLLSPFYYQNYDIPWSVIQILIGIMQFILIYLCFHIPRLQKGMIFLYSVPSGNIGSTLCLVLIMLILIAIQTENATVPYMSAFFSLILLSSIFLIYWWNYHLTQTYRKFLRKNELDSLSLLLEERNQEIAYLRSENDKLARIIHKDNKIIPALSMAVIDSYENKTELDLSELETDSSLYIKLKQLYAERTETLEKYQQEIMHLPQTAFDSVNAVLSYMQSEALKSGIPYQVVLFDNLNSTIPNEITEDDFTHILSDLLANAINACKGISSASIQVYLGKMEGISTIKICNTGNVFNIETLKNLGLARHTTHADTGGSGIGLMDIWTIKQRYVATLLIDESIGTDTSSTHTCINILFNHKNHYMIQSDRHKELGTYINRPDVMIISKE